MIGQTVSHYRVASKLGGGGMGVVYEAEDTRLGRRVALKFLPAELAQDASSLQRFQREARAASALNHPNICTVHAIEEHEAQHFIVMELLEGRDARRERLAAGPLELGPLLDLGDPDRRRARVGARARASSTGTSSPPTSSSTRGARRRSSTSGWPRSSARAAKGREDTEAPTCRAADELTKAGSTMGTVSYMSPEQARGQLTDARTRYLFARRRALPDGDRDAAVPGRDLGGRLRSDPQPRARGRHEMNPRAAGRAQPHHGQRAGEGPRPPLPDRERHEDRHAAVEARPRFGQRARAGRERRDPRAGTAKAAEKSVAVLYFENLSGVKEDEYLRDGVTEDIITELSKIKG